MAVFLKDPFGDILLSPTQLQEQMELVNNQVRLVVRKAGADDSPLSDPERLNFQQWAITWTEFYNKGVPLSADLSELNQIIKGYRNDLIQLA